MPRLPFIHRPGDADPTQANTLLGGGAGSVGDEWQGVAEVLRAAAAPTQASELAGQAAVLAAFRRAHLGTPSYRRPRTRPRMLNALLTGKLAAALTAAVVGASGAATAAYAGALPDSVQNVAHHLIAAPPAHSHASANGRAHGHVFANASPSASASPSPSPSASETATPTPTPTPTATATATASVSPSANPTGDEHAAFGLCTAWANAVAHDRTDQVGFRDKLGQLAGGDDVDTINAFCTTVQHPGDDAASESPETESPDQDATAGDDSGVQEHHGKSDEAHGHNGKGGDKSPTPTPTVTVMATPTATTAN